MGAARPVVPPFGFVNALKPPGPSSTAFGAWVRRRIGASALGHWGTLDPSAAGVLVLAYGAATRLLPFIADSTKDYVFELRVGVATETGDAHGKPVAQAKVDRAWADGLPRAAASLVGDLMQIPPRFSAVKVAGRPLYRAARKGMEVQAPARTVTIHHLRVLGIDGATARMTVSCSAGTYVRTLCEQIGDRLGLPAHMGFLLRTRAGPFNLAAAATPAQIEGDPASCVVDPQPVLAMPSVDVDDDGAARFRHGNHVSAAPSAAMRSSQEAHVLVLHDGALIGIARIRDSLVVPVRVLVAGAENR